MGGAAAAALAGIIHDATGNYAAAIYLAGTLGLIAGALAFNLRPRPPAPVAMGAAD